MKVIQVEHDRCGEPDKYEYFLVLNEMTEDEISEAIDKAQDAYLASVDNAKKAMPMPEWPRTDISNFPADMTMAEAMKQVEETRKVRDQIEKQRLAVHTSFEGELKKFGIVNVRNFDFEDRFVANWGHRHGDKLDY